MVLKLLQIEENKKKSRNVIANINKSQKPTNHDGCDCGCGLSNGALRKS